MVPLAQARATPGSPESMHGFDLNETPTHVFWIGIWVLTAAFGWHLAASSSKCHPNAARDVIQLPSKCHLKVNSGTIQKIGFVQNFIQMWPKGPKGTTGLVQTHVRRSSKRSFSWMRVSRKVSYSVGSR